MADRVTTNRSQPSRITLPLAILSSGENRAWLVSAGSRLSRSGSGVVKSGGLDGRLLHGAAQRHGEAAAAAKENAWPEEMSTNSTQA